MALPVRASTRDNQQIQLHSGAFVVGEINGQTDWRGALQGVDRIVHLAARAHVVRDSSIDPMADFRRFNVEGTAKLARQVADHGVRRLVFVSSIKVNSESTSIPQFFSADDPPSPKDPFGVSKYDVVQLLRCIAAESGMEIVIIRSPLVYGPSVKANFSSMMRWLARGH